MMKLFTRKNSIKTKKQIQIYVIQKDLGSGAFTVKDVACEMRFFDFSNIDDLNSNIEQSEYSEILVGIVVAVDGKVVWENSSTSFSLKKIKELISEQKERWERARKALEESERKRKERLEEESRQAALANRNKKKMVAMAIEKACERIGLPDEVSSVQQMIIFGDLSVPGGCWEISYDLTESEIDDLAALAAEGWEPMLKAAIKKSDDARIKKLAIMFDD